MNPANQYAAELVKSGKLGKIMRVHATDQDILLDPSIPIAWRHINKLAGSGALGDLCSHLLSVSQMIMGDRRGARRSVHRYSGASGQGRQHRDGQGRERRPHHLPRQVRERCHRRLLVLPCATGRRTKATTRFRARKVLWYTIWSVCARVQVYFKADADKDNGRDCGFRTVLLNPQHEGFKYFQPAGGIAIAFDDMKTLQARTHAGYARRRVHL